MPSSDLCPPMLFKLRPRIQQNCNVYYPPTPSLGWIGQIKRSFTVIGFSPERFLVSVFPASEKFDSDLELDGGMHKNDAHPCPPMPTQNPRARVGMDMGTQCRALVDTTFRHSDDNYNTNPSPSNLSHVMLTFDKTHLCPTWNLHSDTCKDEIESPQQYVKRLRANTPLSMIRYQEVRVYI
jgi:hypothetical protein